MVWTIDDSPTASQLDEIASTLQRGSVVLMPADTIYGLHALALNPEAAARVAEIKGREDQKPFIVLAATPAQLSDLGVQTSPAVMSALFEIWPGPLTAILPLRAPIAASRGASTLAVRVPALDWLRLLLTKTGPLLSTSANRSGEPAIDRVSELPEELKTAVEIVDGGVRIGEPSAIVDLSKGQPRLIREGNPVFTQNLWKTLWKLA